MGRWIQGRATKIGRAGGLAASTFGTGVPIHQLRHPEIGESAHTELFNISIFEVKFGKLTGFAEITEKDVEWAVNGMFEGGIYQCHDKRRHLKGMKPPHANMPITPEGFAIA